MTDRYTRTIKEVDEYVGHTHRYGDDVRRAVEELSDVTISVLKDPPGNATKTQTCIWEKMVDEFLKRFNYYEENMKSLYSLVWGKCTDILRATLEAQSNFHAISTNGDSLQLLISIKAIVFNFQEQKYQPQSIHEAKRRFYLYYQDRNTSCQDYLEKYQHNIDVIEHCGVSIGLDQGMIQLAKKHTH